MPDRQVRIAQRLQFNALLGAVLSMSACAPVFRTLGIPLRAHCVGTGVTSVSASPDSSEFVISYCEGKKSLIATGDYRSEESKVVLTSDSSLLQRPIFLDRAGDIGFIERSTIDKSAVKVVHRDGSTDQLTDKGPADNIRDIALGPEGATIYCLTSLRYGRSTPVGPDLPHDNDFYAFSIHDRPMKRLSFSNEYHLLGLSISRDGKTIFSRSDVLESGDSTIKKLKYEVDKGLPFTSDQLTYTSEFPLSPVSTKNQMILSCGKITRFRKFLDSDSNEVKGYGLFVVTLPGRIVTKELLYGESYLDSPAILEKERVVLFIRQPYKKPFFGKLKRELWSVHLDGSGLKRIQLPGVE